MRTETSTLRRQYLTLSEPAERWLEAEARRLGVTRAEVLRRIIDRIREEQEERLQREKVA
jgi:hypothetical protein